MENTEFPRELCSGCPHPPHYGQCPHNVIDLTHAPVDHVCWCRVRADDSERKPVGSAPTSV